MLDKNFRKVLKQTRAWAWAIAEMLINLVYLWANTQILESIEEAMTQGSLDIAGQAILLCVVTIVTGGMAQVVGRSPFMMYNGFNNLLSDKVFEGIPQMYIDLTQARINSVMGKLNPMSKVLRYYLRIFQSLCQITFCLIYINRKTGIYNVPMFSCIIIVSLTFYCSIMRYRKLDATMKEIAKNRDQHLNEGIEGYVEHNIYLQTGHGLAKVVRVMNDEIMNTIFRRQWWSVLAFESVDIGSTIVLGIMLWETIVTKAVTPAVGIAIVMYWWRIEQPLMQVTEIIPELSEAMVGFKDYADLIEYANPVKDGTLTFDNFNKLVFDRVTFWYKSTTKTLKKVSFTIEKGKWYAFTGESGGGKSTLLSLIQRFYDVKSGRILIDGINIKEFSLESLRSRIAMVSQKTFIFNASLYDNIAFPLKFSGLHPSEIDKRVREAIKIAALEDWVNSHADEGGLNALVGNRGITLSGGLQQRVAIARALVLRPWILLLDEATSALDNETEAAIVRALRTLRKTGITVISVAHRLSTIKDYDRIFVLKNNRIVQEGTYAGLESVPGEFRRLIDAAEEKSRL